jgi:ribosome-associated translation inhibitor RaiA
LRRAGRATAEHYTWSQVMRRILLPRLRFMADSYNGTATAQDSQGKKGRMRLHIEGQHTNIPPHLLGWIAERLEDLDAPHGDILQARVTLAGHKNGQRCRQEARVELVLAAETLFVTQVAKTPYDAVCAALKAAERELRNMRTLERV